MRRILLASHDASLTGAPLVLLQLARLLQAEHAVHVWSPRPGPLLKLCPGMGIAASSGAPPALRGYDLVIGSSIASGDIILHAHRAGVAAVWWPHEGELVRAYLWRDELQQAMVHPATHVVVSAEYLRPLYRNGRNELPALIRYAVPRTARIAAPPGEQAHPDAAPRGVRFLVAGTVEPRKGQDVALAAFARVRRDHPDARCTVIGAGWGTPWARELATRYADVPGLALRPPVLPAAFTGVLDEHDVLLAPSQDEGGFPQVLLQAQERGLAVVAADICGMREQVEDGITGLIAGHDAWASCMERLLGDRDERTRLGQQARLRVHANNGLDAHLRAWSALIARV